MIKTVFEREGMMSLRNNDISEISKSISEFINFDKSKKK